MRLSTIAALSLFALSDASASQAPLDTRSCSAPFERLLADPVFGSYPARPATRAARRVAPDVRRGNPHLYRTIIREEASSGPNFAGHYTVIRIGCGAATICLAIADTKTGKVFFPPELEEAEALLVDTGEVDVDTLNYRKDSRLLIVVGTPNEHPKSAGMSYYLWKSGKLRLIRFVPEAKLCNGS